MIKRLILGALLSLCCVFETTALVPFDPETSSCDEFTFGMTRIASGRVEMEPIWIAEIIQPCAEGTYLPQNEIECTQCTANHYCPGTQEETIISTTEDRGIVVCDSGLHSSVGAKTAAECCPEGKNWNEQQQQCVSAVYVCQSTKWFHIGEGDNDKVCLESTKPEGTPSLAISLGVNNVYYLRLSQDENLPISAGSTKKLRVKYNGVIYNAHDDSVSGNN